jgi:GNAT superfamily N-acetyltransferase
VEKRLAGSITELSVGHSQAVRTVINASNRSAYRSVIPAEYFKEEVLPSIAMPGLFRRMTFYGYWHEDRLAGVAALEKVSRDTMQMRWVYVAPDFQRMGVGSALVKHLEEVAGRSGVSEIRLRTTDGADWAISFYRKLGYHVTGSVARSWGADIWMQKSLRPAD